MFSFLCGSTAAAAVRGRSSLGGSRPGLGSLTCSFVESQCRFKIYDFCGTTHRAPEEDLAFPDLEVLLDVPGLAAAAAVPHLPTHLQVYGHE